MAAEHIHNNHITYTEFGALDSDASMYIRPCLFAIDASGKYDTGDRVVVPSSMGTMYGKSGFTTIHIP